MMVSDAPAPAPAVSDHEEPDHEESDREEACKLPQYYRHQDCNALSAAAPGIMEFAEALRREHMPPKPFTRSAVFSIILDLIQERGRKVYGGWALDAALRQSKVAHEQGVQPLYADAANPPDIEFYSPDPVRDVKDICDRAHKSGLRFVQGREAAHTNTFTVSVEFVRFCDVTFMPAGVLPHIPVLQAGVCMPAAHKIWSVEAVLPEFGAIDQLRLVSDPFCSYWRLDRTLSRLAVTDRVFACIGGPLLDGWEGTTSVAALGLLVPRDACAGGPVMAAARAWLAQSPSCVAIGVTAFRHFMEAAGDAYAPSWTPAQITVVSVDYDRDVRTLSELLCRASGGTVSVTEYSPFLDFMGRSAIACMAPGVAVTLIDAMHRAVPLCGDTDDATGLRVASFPYTVMMLHALRFRAYVQHDLGRAGMLKTMASALCAARNAHLSVRGVTAADPSCRPFHEFSTEFVGEPLSTMHVHMMRADERRARSGSGAWMSYDPSKPKPLPPYVFLPCSGEPCGFHGTGAEPASAPDVQGPSGPQPAPPARRRGGRRGGKGRGGQKVAPEEGAALAVGVATA